MNTKKKQNKTKQNKKNKTKKKQKTKKLKTAEESICLVIPTSLGHLGHLCLISDPQIYIYFF